MQNHCLSSKSKKTIASGSRPRPARPWRRGGIANVKAETVLPHDGPPDAGAEFDRIETFKRSDQQ